MHPFFCYFLTLGTIWDINHHDWCSKALTQVFFGRGNIFDFFLREILAPKVLKCKNLINFNYGKNMLFLRNRVPKLDYRENHNKYLLEQIILYFTHLFLLNSYSLFHQCWIFREVFKTLNDKVTLRTKDMLKAYVGYDVKTFCYQESEVLLLWFLNAVFFSCIKPPTSDNKWW